MIKLIIFDLDGVLIEAKKIHFNALNKALGEKYAITWDEHLLKFDGLKTTDKLNRLHVPAELQTNVWNLKQKYTMEAFELIKPDVRLQEILHKLKDNFMLICCSNSIKQSVHEMLKRLGLLSYFTDTFSNEDVTNSKPHPEMYWKAMAKYNLLPDETIILEDSPHGMLAAKRSGAHVLRIDNPTDLTYEKIIGNIVSVLENGTETYPYQGGKLNIVIPMAGAGSRFAQAGYTFPKPLIEVNGKTMIQLVVENLNIQANYIFIVNSQQRKKYNLDTMLRLISPDCKIIEVDEITKGAACTTLLADRLFNNEDRLLIANSDQFLEWDSDLFLYQMNEQNADGGIVTFESNHPKWSYALIDENGLVIEVAEKMPISTNATVGIYYWRRGSDYVKYARKMIEKNITTNGEFYVCPVFKEAIADGKKIYTYKAKKMWGLGTPEDLDYFIKNHR